jgi:hypothetical protein
MTSITECPSGSAWAFILTGTDRDTATWLSDSFHHSRTASPHRLCHYIPFAASVPIPQRKIMDVPAAAMGGGGNFGYCVVSGVWLR